AIVDHELADEEQGPAIADDVERLGDGALLSIGTHAPSYTRWTRNTSDYLTFSSRSAILAASSRRPTLSADGVCGSLRRRIPTTTVSRARPAGRKRSPRTFASPRRAAPRRLGKRRSWRRRRVFCAPSSPRSGRPRCSMGTPPACG